LLNKAATEKRTNTVCVSDIGTHRSEIVYKQVDAAKITLRKPEVSQLGSTEFEGSLESVREGQYKREYLFEMQFRSIYWRRCRYINPGDQPGSSQLEDGDREWENECR
jgi:hypothetical protein